MENAKVVKRIDLAINVMKRAGSKIMMADWQRGDHPIARTEKELHSCGNTACFAGYLVISPEFQKLGLRASHVTKQEGGGQPELSVGGEYDTEFYYGEDAIREILGITHYEAVCLVSGILDETWNSKLEFHSNFYDKNWGAVTSEDVIAKLEEMKKKYM